MNEKWNDWMNMKWDKWEIIWMESEMNGYHLKFNEWEIKSTKEKLIEWKWINWNEWEMI